MPPRDSWERVVWGGFLTDYTQSSKMAKAIHVLGPPLLRAGKPLLLLGPLRAFLQDEQGQLSQSFLVCWSSHSINLTIIHWPQSSLPMFFLNSGSQNWTQCSSSEITSTEQRRVIKSLNLLAALLATELRTLLVIFADKAYLLLTLSSLSTSASRAFPEVLLPSQAVLLFPKEEHLT